MHNKGHERAHIHPNGWLSGVFYLNQPDVLDDPERNPDRLMSGCDMACSW